MLASLFFAAALAATPADADAVDGAAPPDTAVVEIEGTRVLGARPIATRGGSSAVTATLDSLPVAPAATLEQVLRALPAVHVRTNSRGEAELSVRGSESRQVAVLFDGIPLTLSWDGRTDPSVIPVGALQEVTLVRGLSSLLSGPNVLGGVLDFRSGGVATRPGPPAPRLGAGVDESGGYGLSGSVTVPRALGDGLLTMRAGAGRRDTPGQPLARDVREPVPADDDLRINTDAVTNDAFAALRLDRPGGAWASLASSAYRTERGIAAELGVDEPRYWRYPFLARSLTVLSGGSGVRRAPWGGTAGLQGSLGLDVGRTEIDVYDGIDYRTVASREDGDQRGRSLRVTGSQTVGEDVSLRVGVTSSELTYDEHLDPGGSSRYRHRMWSVAGEALLRRRMAPGGLLDEVDLSVGGAFDRSTYPLSGGKPAVEPQNEFGGRVGVSALLAGGAVTLHASANRRARFASLRELYSGALGRFDPSPGLRPERLRAVEGGVMLRDARGSLQLVGFHQRLDDAVVRIRVGRLFRRVNQEGLRSTGAELVGSRRMGPWTVAGDLVAQSVDLLDPSAALERPENLPEVSGGARGEVELPQRVTLGAGVRFKGDQYALDPDTGDLTRLAGRARVGADIARTWSLGAGWFSTLLTRVAVDNLTDEAVYDAYGLPEPGRMFRFEMRVQ
jgi:iron complex outermembrane receptor protein